LLLPHGYEGNGPEHSSARLERFLQLAAQENIRIANCTTAAQYFHLLRRQALDPSARPLVVMTPKGLLRLKQAASALPDLAEASFRPVLGDAGADPPRVRRLVLCSGKVYYDLVGHELRTQADWVEQFYTVTYAHPSVEAITWWSFTDDGYVPAAGYTTESFEPKESFYRLKELEKSWGFDLGKK
jgi:2-oxoglutarate dehydrogenase complex dehydrogenase (E1) component-like enzyme